MPPDITVAIPTLNEEDFLPDCLESLQTAADRFDGEVEILVLDSDSEDRTPRIAAEHPAVNRVITVPPGILTARHHGFEEASHSIVVCADADAVYEEDYLTNLITPFQEQEDVVLTYGQVKGLETLHADVLLRLALQHGLPHVGMDWVSGSSRAVDRDMYFASGGFKPIEQEQSLPRVIFEEQFHWPQRMKKYGKIVFVKDAVSRQSSRTQNQLFFLGEKNGGASWDIIQPYTLVRKRTRKIKRKLQNTLPSPNHP